MWKHKDITSPTYGYLEMIDTMELMSEQGTQSEVFFAFNAFHVKLPVLCKVIDKLDVNVEKIISAQNLAASFGIAPTIYEIHENAKSYRIVMELLSNITTLSSFVETYGIEGVSRHMKDELVRKIKLLYTLQIDHGDIHSDNVLVQTTVINGAHKLYIIDYDDVIFPVSVRSPKQMHTMDIKLGYIFVFDETRVDFYRSEMLKRYDQMKTVMGNKMADKLKNTVFFH
jgi:tRNA A-37 threonylcarbamoyl transferase component Bud32